MSGPIKSSFAKAVAAIKEPAFQKSTERFVEGIAAKVPIITGIKLNGSRPHKSHDDPADPKPVISFALYKSNKLNSRNRVASGHVHDDGTGHVNFPSKYKQYRVITGMEYKPPGSGTSGQSSSGKSKSGGSDLTWRTNEQTKYAEWWDGTKWVAGDWSNEYKNGMLITMANAIIGKRYTWDLRTFVFAGVAHILDFMNYILSFVLSVLKTS